MNVEVKAHSTSADTQISRSYSMRKREGKKENEGCSLGSSPLMFPTPASPTPSYPPKNKKIKAEEKAFQVRLVVENSSLVDLRCVFIISVKI